MGQKGLKLAFLAKNSRFLGDFFLNGIGGYPPPLTDNQCAQKSLAAPLNRQNPLKHFDSFPYWHIAKLES